MGSQHPRFDVKRVAIVGAGPAGLAAAKYLVDQQSFTTIDIFEQQPEVGGVWNYSPRPSTTLHVPQVSPFTPPDPPLPPDDNNPAPIFPSPMYETLHTNIPRGLMRFSDLAFPSDSLIFPSRETVQSYLVTYSQPICHLIHFSHLVQSIHLTQATTKDQWTLTTLSLLTNTTHTTTYDAVIVASGHYATPYLPSLPSITAFHALHPTTITHSKLYRTPTPYTNKKVLIVGNAASGLDIAAQISRVCRPPLLLSARTPTPAANLAFVAATEVPPIAAFLPLSRGVLFTDGREEHDLDHIIFATGYLFTYPFLTALHPPLVSDGRRVRGVYRDLLHAAHPTLAFAGLPIKVVPFSVCEAQAAVVARTWAGRWALPGEEAMRREEEEEEERRGPAFHVWPKLADAEFVNAVHERVVREKGVGKEPPFWDDELVWQRKICFDAKLRFEIEGRKAKSLEELGFVYQPGGDPDTGSPERDQPVII